MNEWERQFLNAHSGPGSLHGLYKLVPTTTLCVVGHNPIFPKRKLQQEVHE